MPLLCGFWAPHLVERSQKWTRSSLAVSSVVSLMNRTAYTCAPPCIHQDRGLDQVSAPLLALPGSRRRVLVHTRAAEVAIASTRPVRRPTLAPAGVHTKTVHQAHATGWGASRARVCYLAGAVGRGEPCPISRVQRGTPRHTQHLRLLRDSLHDHA